MLLKRTILEGILAGRVTLAFRRWKKPTVRAGGTLCAGGALLAIEEVEVVSPDSLTELDARNAGFASLGQLRASLTFHPESPLYRVRLRVAGADPRLELRRQTAIGQPEIDKLKARLARLDAAGLYGPWIVRVLQWIRRHPARRARDMAAELNLDVAWMKVQIRKLKALGLTESLEIGYRLSPRGREVLTRLENGE